MYDSVTIGLCNVLYVMMWLIGVGYMVQVSWFFEGRMVVNVVVVGIH